MLKPLTHDEFRARMAGSKEPTNQGESMSIENWQKKSYTTAYLWTAAVVAAIGLVVAALVYAWKACRAAFLGCLVLGALSLTACGVNPMEGEYGPVAWVPEQDSCWVTRRVSPTRQETVRGLCDGRGHDLEVMGHWRYW